MEYNSFTMLVSALQWSESAICIHMPAPPEASLPPSIPPRLGHHRTCWAPWAAQQLPRSGLCLLRFWVFCWALWLVGFLVPWLGIEPWQWKPLGLQGVPGSNVFMRRELSLLFTERPLDDTERWVYLEARKGPLLEAGCASTSLLDFTASRALRKKCLWFQASSLWFVRAACGDQGTMPSTPEHRLLSETSSGGKICPMGWKTLNWLEANFHRASLVAQW